MRTYIGKREDGILKVFKRDSETAPLHEMPLRLDLWKHSPAGFDCGYGGQGPAQLSLAILADHLKDDARAVRYHQSYKWMAIAKLSRENDWELGAGEVDCALAAIEIEVDKAKSAGESK